MIYLLNFSPLICSSGEFDTLLFFFFNMKIKDERVIGHLLISKSSFIGCVGVKNVVLGLSVKKGVGGGVIVLF